MMSEPNNPFGNGPLYRGSDDDSNLLFGERRTMSRDDRYGSRRGYDRERSRGSETLMFLGYMISETIAVPASAEKLMKLSQWVHTAEGNSVRVEHGAVRMPMEWYTIVGIMTCAHNAPTSETTQALLNVYSKLFETPTA